MKKIKKNIFLRMFPLMIVVLSVFLMTGMVFAADQACDTKTQLCNPIRFNSIPEFFEELLKIAAQIGSIVIILGLVYSGFLFISARGNQEELSKAKKSFTYTVIGAMIVLGAWAFSVAIGNTIRTITNPPAGGP